VNKKKTTEGKLPAGWIVERETITDLLNQPFKFSIRLQGPLVSLDMMRAMLDSMLRKGGRFRAGWGAQKSRELRGLKFMVFRAHNQLGTIVNALQVNALQDDARNHGFRKRK